MNKLLLILLVFFCIGSYAQDTIKEANHGGTGLDIPKPETVDIQLLTFSFAQFDSLDIPVSIKKKNFRRNCYSYNRYLKWNYYSIWWRHMNFMVEINGILHKKLSDTFYKNFDFTLGDMIKNVEFIPKSEYNTSLPLFKAGVLSITLNDSIDIDSYKWEIIDNRPGSTNTFIE